MRRMKDVQATEVSQMRRLGFTFALALLVALLGLRGAASAQDVVDVGPSHWAYEAVKDLVERGYLALDDGRFRGGDSVDRFTLATTVARILHDIETGAVTPQSQSDVELLRRVVNEFREDLVEAYARIEEAEGQIDRTGKNLAATDDTVSNVIAQLGRLQSELQSQLESELQSQSESIDRAQAALRSEMQENVSALRGLIDDLAASLGESTASVRQQSASGQEALRGEVSDLIATLRADVDDRFAQTDLRLDELAGSTADDVMALQESLNQVAGDLRGLATGADAALEEIRSQLNAQAEALAAQQLAVEQQRGELESRLLEQSETSSGQFDALSASDRAMLASLETLEATLSELDEQVASLQTDVDEMSAVTAQIEGLRVRVDGVERELLALQSQIGLSEEQMSALSERLMNELESQYQHSFLLSGNVSQELKELREEFNSYRQSTEADLSKARQAQTFGIIGALLGLIGLAN